MKINLDISPIKEKKKKIETTSCSKVGNFCIREIKRLGKGLAEQRGREDRELRPWRILRRTSHLTLSLIPIHQTALILLPPLFPPLLVALLFVFSGLPVTPLLEPSWAPFSATVSLSLPPCQDCFIFVLALYVWLRCSLRYRIFRYRQGAQLLLKLGWL